MIKFNRLLVLTCSVLASCAVDAGKYHKEKDTRIETQIALNNSREREDSLKKLFASIQKTENYFWIYRTNFPRLDIAVAEKFCLDIGYDLPTADMLSEAQQNEIINKIANFRDFGTPIYVKGEFQDQYAFYLLCARKAK